MKGKAIWAAACLSIAGTASAGQARQSQCEQAKAKKLEQQARCACIQAKQQAQRADAAERQLRCREAQVKQLQQQRDEAQARAQAALEQVGKVRQEERGMVVTLAGPVLFEFGKANLLPDARERLDIVASAMEANPNQSYRIEGFTDSKGSREYNADLSKRRAQAVRDYLVDKGVKADQIIMVGFGEEHPIASNDTPEGRANNRRVEIVLPSMGVGGAGQAGQPGKQPQPAPSRGDAEQGGDSGSNQQIQPPSQVQ